MPFWFDEAEHVLAGDEVGADRDRGAGQVDVVDDRRPSAPRSMAVARLVLGIGERAATGRDDRRIVDRGDGDGPCSRQLLFSAPSLTTNETVRAKRARIVAAVEIADRAQRGLVVGNRAAAAQRQHAGRRIPAAADAVLVGEAEHVLAGDEIADDRHRRAGQVDVVEIGDRQRRDRSTVAAWFSV